jgi:Tfp pilus assembly protein PilE
MIGNRKGFTLVELVVVMGIFIIIIIIATQAFESIFRIAGHQTKSAASQIEGIVGLEMMRTDLAHAGYGLPWQFQNSPTAYTEVTVSPAANTGVTASSLNDVPPAVPRAIVVSTAGAGATVVGSHYMAIKSALLALPSANSSVGRWGRLIWSTAGAANTSSINRVNDNATDLRDGTAAAPNDVQDRVITIRSEFSNLGGENKVLVMNGSAFSYAVPNGYQPPDDSYKPADEFQTLTTYGISDTNLRMPYNRADYYISRPATGDANFKIPDFCNSGTGVLFKAVADHAGGYGPNAAPYIYPLLNCAGDMRVVFFLDMDDDGNPQTYANAADGTNTASAEGAADVSTTLADAGLLRQRLKTAYVYVLSHEGKKDPSYSYPVTDVNRVIVVGPPDMPSIGHEWSQVAMAAQFGADWRNYRWKVYSFEVNTRNLQ